MIINTKVLPLLRKRHENRQIVLCTGSFDLPHAGHVLFFEDCKKLGDVLVVGVGSDKIIKENKGKDRPILNQFIRAKVVDSLKSVDYVYIDTLGKPNVQLSSLEDALRILQPHIYAVNEDGFNMARRKVITDKHGIKMVVLKRVCPKKYGNISTTGIINKILKSETAPKSQLCC